MKNKVILFILCLLAGIAAYPVVFLIVGSFMNSDMLYSYLSPVLIDGEGYASWGLFPWNFSLKSYIELLVDAPSFFVMFWNSIKIVMVILVGQMIIAIPAAWGLAKYTFPLKKVIYFVYIVLMLMPFQVLMLPEYLVFDRISLVDSHLSVILPCIFSTFPIFIMQHLFSKIPNEVIEAAKLESANDFQVFIYIGLPLGKQGIISALVLGFLEYWNLIEQPLAFLKDKTLWPMSLFLPNISIEEIGIAFVTSIIAFVPCGLVFVFGRGYLEQGITVVTKKE
ncbi:multiple sugar transport system permease protein [Aequitasia blattaphilus]|uniref:Carbohydrate ABC transporter permease n=1 Tax=Aequitasia blattaphilus TaxID=2949332 RepID=A0ABT1E9A2_9FIRM|nr:carbohydrate ABC transporter permease [Aequitasia blattaphilus]MCP1101451.1 carbohydrate ABC transporter permease [Aequitasia blattaphilus]MCR8614091.1 carbohydrate ABC transporter permease [Aequitasia blattaphilus]